jgi:hypothetical protein
MGYALALFAPARKYELDLARALVHQGDLLLDDDIAEAAQLRCQLLRFGGQRVKSISAGTTRSTAIEKLPLVSGAVCFVINCAIFIF